MNIIRLNTRPQCQEPGCDKLAAHIHTNKNTGWTTWRKRCSTHHSRKTGAKHGLANMQQVIAKNAGFAEVSEYNNHKARAKGFKSYTQYKNSTHPYLRYRKDHCENIDGRLGYVCTTTIVNDCQLDVDHNDGDPSNNEQSNLQTLCKCCHSYKTWKSKDYKTPGRKALGIKR